MTWLLAVGGSDPSCGAGLDADRAAARAAGVRLVTIESAATDQDDAAVRAVGPREPWAWKHAALEACAREHTNPAALKLGLLPGSAHVEAAASLADQLAFDAPGIPVVVDPVLVSTSGFVFARPADYAALLARAVVLTPNVPELAALAGADPALVAADRGARLAVAQALLLAGPRALVVKGGHGTEPGGLADLALARDAAPVWLARPRLPGPGIRGSGCRFATTLAAHLARGADLATAARAAGEAVATCIAAGSR
jgi:hydroxymethylpyrimidine/phosphomethylpyrimidine kinase